MTDGNPAGHYGTSKMAGEAIGMAYASFQEVDFIALRVTAIYGFGMRSPMYIKPMVENAVRGVPTRFATGGPMKRDYTHVLDCCDAIVLALNAPRNEPGAQRVLNVSAGEAHTAARGRRDGAQGRARRRYRDRRCADRRWKRENVKMRAPLDVSAARRVLGWSPQWPLEKGIRRICRALPAVHRKLAHCLPIPTRVVACDRAPRLTHSRQQECGRME